MRALHSGWFHHPSITHPTGPLRPDDATIGLILTVLGGTTILGVLAGLMALDSSTGLLVAILVDDSASLGVAILMGAVLFGLAAFTTVWWPVLRRSQRIVAWALAITCGWPACSSWTCDWRRSVQLPLNGWRNIRSPPFRG